MNKQNFYRSKYQTLNPHWRESSQIYHDLILDNTDKDTHILDVGCGHSTLLMDIYQKTPHTYGIDPDLNAVNRNTYIKNVEKSFVEKMPFKDNFFDIVVCAWVLEHLIDPIAAFKEIHRVLKPGGKVVFLTPNAWNYNVWIIRLVPERFHDFFTKKLYGRMDNDTFPKQYRVNSPKRVEAVLSDTNFKKEKLIVNGDPSYISFDDITFLFAILIEKILNLKLLKKAKVHLIGVYKKN